MNFCNIWRDKVIRFTEFNRSRMRLPITDSHKSKEIAGFRDIGDITNLVGTPQVLYIGITVFIYTAVIM